MRERERVKVYLVIWDRCIVLTTPDSVEDYEIMQNRTNEDVTNSIEG